MPRPLNVILDVTSRCNLKCVMCYFAGTDRLNFPPFGEEPRDGNMPVSLFEKIAGEMFPRAWRVALGCAAEPMIHPDFLEILSIAGRYGVPDLWFPTNLLALTQTSARAILDAGVRTVAASIDGTTKETYEKIRVPAKWERLLSRLELLRDAKRESGRRNPRLRIIFTWMKSNRKELADLPAFARQWASAARDAVRRGLRLSSYPEFEKQADRPKALLARIKRRLWYLSSGIDRWENRRHAFAQGLYGCAYPGRYYVIRPNGAVAQCIYWEGDPIGIYPADGLESISRGAPLARIREGLRRGEPLGTCATCGERRTALYRLRGVAPAPNTLRLPTHPK